MPTECLFSYKVDIHRKADSTETQATLKVSVRIRVSQKQLNPFFLYRKEKICRQKTFHVSRFTGDDSPKITKDGNSNNKKYKESANLEMKHLISEKGSEGQIQCLAKVNMRQGLNPEQKARTLSLPPAFKHGANF